MAEIFLVLGMVFLLDVDHDMVSKPQNANVTTNLILSGFHIDFVREI
jgi:hypothetical protein